MTPSSSKSTILRLIRDSYRCIESSWMLEKKWASGHEYYTTPLLQISLTKNAVALANVCFALQALMQSKCGVDVIQYTFTFNWIHRSKLGWFSNRHYMRVDCRTAPTHFLPIYSYSWFWYPKFGLYNIFYFIVLYWIQSLPTSNTPRLPVFRSVKGISTAATRFFPRQVHLVEYVRDQPVVLFCCFPSYRRPSFQ